jgi:hypothetical protein
MEGLDRSGTSKALVGSDGFSWPFARISFREGGISLVCLRASKEFMGAQDIYSTWTYTKIVLLREFEYLHHFSDKAGNRVEAISQGLPPEMPEEVEISLPSKPRAATIRK